MLSQKAGAAILFSYLCLLLVSVLPFKYIKLIVFTIFMLENLVILCLYLRNKR